MMEDLDSAELLNMVESVSRTRRVDVVPYITGISRNSKYNNNRARSGAIPLLRGEILNTITGYNLSSEATVEIYPNKNGSGTAVEMEDVALSSSDLTFTVPNNAKSGYIYVSVNGIKTLNNLNGYVDYNTETNSKAFDHNTLTDDRYVHIWRVNKQDTFKGSKNSNYPAMSADTEGNLYASFTYYGQVKTYYSQAFTGDTDVDVETSATATGDVTTVFYGYDPPEDTDISVGADGQVNVFYNANFHGGQATHWTGTGASNAGGIFIYDPAATSINYNTNSNTRHRLYRFELYTYDNELNQFKNTRVNRTYNDGSPYVNIAYYDRLANAIKYSYVTSETVTTYIAGNTNYSFTYTTSGTYSGYYATTSDMRNASGYVKIGSDYYALSYYTRNGSWGSYTYYCTFSGYTGNTSSISSYLYTLSEVNAGDTSSYGLPWVTIDGNGDNLDITGTTEDTNETFTFAGGWRPFKLSGSRFRGASATEGTGESVSLTANSNGYPVIFYMDAATGQPRIAFANSRTPTSESNWIVQGVFDSSDANYDTASDYLTCKIDSAGYLHIAFQNSKGQLVYGVSTNNPSNGTTQYVFGTSKTIDDSGTMIAMAMNGTTPFISYYSRLNSYDGMKLAFYNDDFDENNDGVADGDWEVMTAALNQKVTNVRSCIETNAKAYDDNTYTAAIGFSPGPDYRAAFYVGQ